MNPSECWDDEEVFHFHFHTQFFQNNNESVKTATALRQRVNQLISNGYLRHCSNNCPFCGFYTGPIAEFTVGVFLTCCNKSSVANALEFFSKNRGPLSVFVHPITLHPIEDHTRRGMWMGPSIPLDLSKLPVVRDPPPTC
ncbi:hypothetical protein B4U80_14289 [Leptotrombidium deliense]|uniref:Uncharacterized protein n=1 Tax=Leptotrombidium deliense TaxID=299467 RepID=A0A443RY96_9ACAR|nr:hypothetical protein B4U80_14289 [Leptotrombidium deliense]